MTRTTGRRNSGSRRLSPCDTITSRRPPLAVKLDDLLQGAAELARAGGEGDEQGINPSRRSKRVALPLDLGE